MLSKPFCHTQIRMVLNTNFINILCNSFFPFKGTLFIFEKITNLVALKGISCKEYLNISASFLSSLGVIYWFQFDDDWALQRRVRGETPIEDPINLSGGKAIGERVCQNKRAVRRGSIWANLSKFIAKVSTYFKLILYTFQRLIS